VGRPQRSRRVGHEERRCRWDARTTRSLDRSDVCSGQPGPCFPGRMVFSFPVAHQVGMVQTDRHSRVFTSIKKTIDRLPTSSEPEWRASSWQERHIAAVAVAFGLGWPAVVVIGRDEPILWEFTDWFPIPHAVLVLLIGSLVIMAAFASSVRRR
jgi:hypothetical protein